MSDLHHNWHSVEDDAPEARPIDLTTAAREETLIPDRLPSATVQTVSRRPAAMIGMLLVIGMGLSYFGAIDALFGQVTNNADVSVRLTKTGLIPPTITVEPGQRISWTNEDDIPHILASEELLLADGKPMLTSPIFKGAQTSIQIPTDAEGGTFTYESRTNSTIQGSIMVIIPAPPAASSAPSSAAVIRSSASSSTPAAGTIEQSSSQAPAGGEPIGIPVNPYTVSNPIQNPLPGQISNGAPLWQPSGPRPTSQAESGPGLWIAGLLSLFTLLLLTRKAFR